MDDAAGLLPRGAAYADLSFWRAASVTGADAGDWLNDLVTADLAGLAPGRSRRSVLLTPTGRVQAAFAVLARADGFLLVQDPFQPRPVAELLSRYVLSSDVSIRDVTAELALFAFPGLDRAPEVAGTEASTPSTLGSGVDLLAPVEAREAVVGELSLRFVRVSDEALEEWRVRAGIPRLGVDAADDDLPQEAGFEADVAVDKGCYLGQEAVAKVRNLGHPRRIVVALRADAPVSPGDPLLAGDREAGAVTSAAPEPGGTAVIARVRWDAREGPFRTSTGVRLVARAGLSAGGHPAGEASRTYP